MVNPEQSKRVTDLRFLQQMLVCRSLQHSASSVLKTLQHLQVLKESLGKPWESGRQGRRVQLCQQLQVLLWQQGDRARLCFKPGAQGWKAGLDSWPPGENGEQPATVVSASWYRVHGVRSSEGRPSGGSL